MRESFLRPREEVDGIGSVCSESNNSSPVETDRVARFAAAPALFGILIANRIINGARETAQHLPQYE